MLMICGCLSWSVMTMLVESSRMVSSVGHTRENAIDRGRGT
jgi:hypothetical protein